MKGMWVQDPETQTWHLIWNQHHSPIAEPVAMTWCGKAIGWDAPQKQGAQVNWADTLHDECVRKSEEIE